MAPQIMILSQKLRHHIHEMQKICKKIGSLCIFTAVYLHYKVKIKMAARGPKIVTGEVFWYLVKLWIYKKIPQNNFSYQKFQYAKWLTKQLWKEFNFSYQHCLYKVQNYYQLRLQFLLTLLYSLEST